MNTKTIIGAFIVLVIGIAVGWYAHTQPKLAGSPAPSGSSFSQQPLQAVEVTTVSTSTIASIAINGYDKVILQPFCYLNNLAGIGTDNGQINIQVATSSIPNGNIGANGSKNTNYLVNSSLSTTTPATPNWFANQFSTTTAVGANAAGSALATSTLYGSAGTYVNFIADEPLVAGVTGTCGVEQLPL